MIGAGLVGLAAAWELAERGARVAVIERHDGAGREQSTHNSAVVHTGAFLRPGSERARFALAGRDRLVAVAEQLDVPCEECGLLTVARSEAQRPKLETYRTWATRNGVPDVAWLDDAGARRLEPNVAPVVAALYTPTARRIDPAALVARLAERLRRRGVDLRFGHPLTTATRTEDGWSLDAGPSSVAAGHVVNAAGVASGDVAALLGVPGFQIHPCLGEYAEVVGAKVGWVRSMIYAVAPPGQPGIGAHLTRGVDGRLLVGPTATYLPGPDPPRDPIAPLATFAREASELVPGIEEADLRRAPPGVRASLNAPGSGEAFGDFVVRPGPPAGRTFHAIGVESPGLTASFAIGAAAASWYERSVA